MSKLTRVLLATSLLIPLPALAEMAVDEEFVITATRNLQPLDRVGSSISVIDAAEIERRQYSFARDALAALPGVTVSQSGPFGGAAYVRLRGLRSEQTLVLIDGVKVNDPSSPSGAFDFSTIDPHDIARIEVLKGPQSTLYGSDAIGGVVNVITRRGRDGLRLNGFVEAGSYETLRGGLTLSGGDERYDYRLSAGGITTDGISKAEKRDGNTEKDGYESLNFSTNLGVNLVEGLRLEAFARHVDSEFEYDGWGPVTGVADADQVGKTRETTVNFRAIANIMDGRFENIVSGGYHHIDRDTFSNGALSFASLGKRLSLAYQGNLKVVDGLLLTFGAESIEDQIDTPTEVAELSIDSLYAQAQVEFLEGLTVTGGVRYDSHEQFGSHTTFRTTAAYALKDTGTVFRASWGEGFKAPTPYQLTFFCCGAIAPNLDLQPETSEGWDVGVEQTLWADRARVQLTYFHQTTDDLIDYAAGTYFNVDRVRTKGVEAALQLDPLSWLSIDANYTRLSTIDRSTQERLMRLPRDKATVTTTVQPLPRLTLSATGQYSGAATDIYGDIDSWFRLDLRAAYELTDRVELYGRVENLLDEHYQELFGYGTAGLSAYLGVRGRF